MRLGPFGGGDHLRLRRIGPAVKDVVPHRPMQKRAVLLHHADLVAQAVLRDARDVLPVDQDAPAFHVVEPQEQLHQRRFSRTGPPDQPHLLAGRMVRLQSVQPARAAPVVVGDALEPISPLSKASGFARRVGQRDRVR
jgi:hypothetical protein